MWSYVQREFMVLLLQVLWLMWAFGMHGRILTGKGVACGMVVDLRLRGFGLRAAGGACTCQVHIALRMFFNSMCGALCCNSFTPGSLGTVVVRSTISR